MKASQPFRGKVRTNRTRVGAGQSILTRSGLLDMLSDMKRITAREFQKRFGRIAETMREGQTLEVTMHGKPIGRFTKNRTRQRRMPDFVSLLERESCPKELGNQILKEFHDSLS